MNYDSYSHNFLQIWDDSSEILGLQSSRLGFRFNSSLEGVAWPTTLEDLSFGHQFDQDLRDTCLPESLQRLTLGWSFDQELDGMTWPTQLQSLAFKHTFNQSLQPVWHLFVFFWAFFIKLCPTLSWKNSAAVPLRQQVALPSTLRSLTLSNAFNQTLQGVVLPSGLEDLTFGNHFNQPMEGGNDGWCYQGWNLLTRNLWNFCSSFDDVNHSIWCKSSKLLLLSIIIIIIYYYFSF